MKKTDFTVMVADQLGNKATRILKGHDLPGVIVKLIRDRADVRGELANVLYNLTTASQGAKGLSYAPGFKISGYKNRIDFARGIDADIEEFKSFNPEMVFNNQKDMIILLVAQDNDIADTTEEQIETGQIVALKYNQAINGAYDVPNGMYIACLISDEMKRKGRLEMPVEPKTPVDAKKVLKAKYNKKFSALSKTKRKLENELYFADAEMAQYQRLQKRFGGDIASGISGIDMAHDEAWIEINKITKKSDKENRTFARAYLDAMVAGDTKRAQTILNVMTDKNLARVLRKFGAGPVQSGTILTAEQKRLKVRIKDLTKKNVELTGKLDDTTLNSKQLSVIKWNIKKTAKEIKALKQRLALYADLSTEAIGKRKAAAQKIAAEVIAANELGQTLKDAFETEFAKLTGSEDAIEDVKGEAAEIVSDNI